VVPGVERVVLGQVTFHRGRDRVDQDAGRPEGRIDVGEHLADGGLGAQVGTEPDGPAAGVGDGLADLLGAGLAQVHDHD
jgi:hypothetical protein